MTEQEQQWFGFPDQDAESLKDRSSMTVVGPVEPQEVVA